MHSEAERLSACQADHPASSVREQQEHATAVCAATARRRVRRPVDRMIVIDMDLEQSGASAPTLPHAKLPD
jgi:hypothetical protein